MTEPVVPRETAGGGGEQIAHAGGTQERIGTSAHGVAEASDFHKSPAQESPFGVVTEAEAVRHPRADGEDVLKRAAEFHADYVVADRNPERGTSEGVPNGVRSLSIPEGGDRHRG